MKRHIAPFRPTAAGPNPVLSLREAARLLSEGGQLPVPLAAWLGGSLQAFLDRRGGDLEDALGLRWGRGGMPWWMEEAIRERDAALRALAVELAPTASASARARSVHMRTWRYATSAWLRDRTLPSMPDCYRGTDREWLWHAFAAGAAMPLGERRLRQILGGQMAGHDPAET